MKMDRRSRKTHPRRIAFGLPHNYGKENPQKVEPDQAGIDRRASPLFIHIGSCGDRPVAVLSFMPARFLPQALISVGGRHVPMLPEKRLYSPIHEFLDRLLDRHKRKEPFNEALGVP